MEGYTIHSGDIIMDDGEKEFIKIISKGHGAFDGIISQTGRAIGTFVHGIFDNADFTNKFVSYLKSIKFNEVIVDKTHSFDLKMYKEAEYDRWANVLRKSLDIEMLYKIMGIKV